MKGFANPMDLWLRDNLKNYAKECLFKGNASINQYFEKDYIKEIYRLHEENREEYMRQIYLLITFEMWHQSFINNNRQ